MKPPCYAVNGLATASQKEHGGFKQNEERDKTYSTFQLSV